MKRKRVVITGMSALSPLGGDLKETWDNILAGKSGIGPITLFDASEFDVRIAGEVKDFDPRKYGIDKKQERRMDRFVQFGVAAGNMLIEDSGYKITEDNADMVSTILGVGLGGLKTIEDFHNRLLDAGPNRISPFFIPMLIANMAPGQIAISTGAKGVSYVLTSACASGLHALGEAFTDILVGRTNCSLTGGVESTVTAMGVSGFAALRALCSTHNDDPEKSSRPFDKTRNGFVQGEGAGMVFLEDFESAKERGAKIYGEIVGYGASCDAFHMTAPQEDGAGMAQAMKAAIRDAGLKPEQIDHINAHGTSTPLNDLCETRAIKSVFGEYAYEIPIVSNKSQIGHLLGAAGGVESVLSLMTLKTGIIPGTINYENPDPECDLNYMGDGPKKLDPQYVLCNGFGFGGTNCSLVFKRFDE